MERNNSEIINAAEHLLYIIHTGQRSKIHNLCTKSILWKYNHNCSEGVLNDNLLINVNTLIKPSEVKRIKYIYHRINKQPSNHIIATGIYCIYKSVDKSTKEYYFDYTINFVDSLAYYIHISLIGNKNPTKIHRIISVKENIYNMDETEILYIEAMGSHTLWHCVTVTIETMISLKDAEIKLSDNFVKIHRSYIVNVTKIKEVIRCRAVMENGDEIPIPYKKFVSIKNKLLEKEC